MAKTATTKITLFKDRARAKTYSSTSTGKGFLTTTRISKEQFVDGDGVIRDYNKYDDRLHSDGISVSIKKVRDYIEYNFTAFDSWLITLTYTPQEFDFDKVVKDFEKFYNNRLTAYYMKYNGYKFEYLRLIEPYENGAWHVHLLLKSAVEGEQLRLSADVIEKKWKHGEIRLTQIYNAEGLACYFGTVYNNDDIKDKNTLTKTMIKQLRWYHYPVERKIYTKSNGIKKPPGADTTEEEKKDVLQENGYETESYRDSSLLRTDAKTGETINGINYQNFKKRANSTGEQKVVEQGTDEQEVYRRRIVEQGIEDYVAKAFEVDDIF